MGNYLRADNQSGFSIVATVMIMMILALFAAAAVSLITTAAGTGIQEERGVQAFYIADGGMQYTLKKNTYPYYAVTPPPTYYLGDGSFTVSVPILDSNITTGETSTIDVSSTNGFTTSFNSSDATQNQYWVVLCDTASSATPTVSMSSDCEKISATGKTSGTFTTLTRGRDSTDTPTFDHQSSAVVMMYSFDTSDTTKTTTIATRTFGKGDKCTGASSTICVNSTTGFADSGFIRINNATLNNIEDVFYDGKGSGATCGTATSCPTQLCLGSNYASGAACKRRAFDGGGNGTVKHTSGIAIYQSEFSVITTSTGKVPGAILAPLTNIQRVVQGNILSLKDP
ncbi:MAG: hypothetical protein Q8K51_11005 [Nitrospirota bacterium]|nr:hypothetical protein [Nitrospirota bacterium]